LFLALLFGLGWAAVPAPAKVVTVMTANLPCGGWPNEFYYPQSSRIFRGLKPDIAFIQEFNVPAPLSHRDYVDEAFGENFHLYVGSGSIPNAIVSRWSLQTWGEWPDPEVAGSRSYVWAVIDIPGEPDLQGVCVHLKSSSGPSNRSMRLREAAAVRDHVRRNFDPDGYIVVAGDLNTYPSPAEPCLNIFRSFLSTDRHKPADRLGHYFTNATNPRRYQYDWIMPNRNLDQYHTTLYVGAKDRAYPQGIVFDSRVFWDVSEVPPIEENDSYPGGVHHMAVMKAFDLPIPATPVSTPTPVPTPSAAPTAPPSPSPSPPPTATPTVSPSPLPLPDVSELFWFGTFPREATSR